MTTEPDFLKEFDEFLENIDKPPPAKPRLEHLKEKLASADLPKQREVLAQSQELFHEEERRQLSPLERRKRFGRVIPLSAQELRQIDYRDAVDASIYRQRAEKAHEEWLRAQLNEFNMGLW